MSQSEIVIVSEQKPQATERKRTNKVNHLS